ncbi:MAG: hypothetical protein Ct9H300mP21_06770 [Pseudomonadota bacterium]|nr:MAG: hypothetical protein Ct9H300mP21_06770 [Pseudomonadota bacterium]
MAQGEEFRSILLGGKNSVFYVWKKGTLFREPTPMP